MNAVLDLVKKDLLRNLKRPWGIIVLLCIPLIMAGFMSIVFGGNRDIAENITIHIAVMDQDDDFLAGILRSMSSQEDATNHIVTHYVESEEEGIAMLEKRKASAFLVFPQNMTADLLDGATTTIGFYANPAEQIYPIVVEQGVDLIAEGLTQAVNLFGPQLNKVRKLIDADRMPSSLSISLLSYSVTDKLRTVEPYLFPPLIQMDTVAAKDFIPSASRVENATKTNGSAP